MKIYAVIVQQRNFNKKKEKIEMLRLEDEKG